MRTSPGNEGSPHDSALIDAPATLTLLTRGRVANALENQEGTAVPAVDVELMRSRSSRPERGSDEVLLERREAVEADRAVRRRVRAGGQHVDHVALGERQGQLVRALL